MFITDLFENDDMFAGSERVATQIQQDRHPLHEYLTFDDYDLLMDELHDAQLHVRNDAELDAYLEQFYHNLTRLPVDELFVNIVEDLVHGRHGKYGTVVPRNNEPLLYDLNDAFRRTWTEQKTHTTVYNLTKAMASACLAAINVESDDINESDDMFTGTTVGTVLKWYTKLDELCDETGKNADELLRSDSDTWSKIYYNLVERAYPANVVAQANEEQRQQIIQDIKGFISDIQQESGINEDEMFAQSKRVKYTKMINEILDYLLNEGIPASVVPEMNALREKLINLQSTLNNQGLRNFIDIVEHDKNLISLILPMLHARNGVTMAQIEKEAGLTEEDDMFAASDRTSKIPASIIIGDSEFLQQKKIKNLIMDYAKMNNLKILGAVPDSWRLEIYFRASVDDIYPLVLELEDLANNDYIVTILSGTWDVKNKKPVISESEDEMFARTPIEKFADGITAYVKSKQRDIDQQHPSWEDHWMTAEDKRIIARLRVILGFLNDPKTRMHGLNSFARIINGTENTNWIIDVEDFLSDNKYPTIVDMLQRYDDQLNEGADPMFSTSVRNVASFDTLFDEIIPDIDDDMKDDFAGYLYDFDTPEAVDKINERIPDNITITNAYWNDEKEDWVFTFKKR